MGDTVELKKKRIAELRSARAKAQQVRDESILQPIVTNGNSSQSKFSSSEIEDILRDVGIPTTPNLDRFAEKTVLPDSMTESSVLSAMSSQLMNSSKLVNLEIGSATSADFTGKVSSSYAKATQTDEERVTNSVGEFSLGSQEFDYDDDMLNMDHFRGRAHSHDLESPIQMSEDIARLLPNLHNYTDQNQQAREAEQEVQKVQPLSSEDLKKIVLTDDFQTSINRGFRLLEKALAESDENEAIYIDYSKDDKADEVKSSELMQLTRVFKDEKWTANRAVTGIDYSQIHSDLLAVSYDEDETNEFSPRGVVLIWNQKVKVETPEFAFHCSARVTTVTFAHFHKHLVFAGCYSGQICVWDNRVLNKKTPISVSAITPTAHTRPIRALNVVGTENASTLMSLCSDGRMSSWVLDNISHPVQTKDLQCNNGKQICAECMAVPANETDNVLIGTQTGQIHEYAISTTGSTSPNAVKTFDGHSLTIQSLSFNKAIGVTDFSHLFLSTSIDSSIRLWSTKDPKLSLRFDSHYQMVVGVAWSPVHPAVFLSTDIAGWLFLWNLNEDTESPVVKLLIGEDVPLSKIRWNNEGSQFGVGDAKGNLYSYRVHERMYVINSDEWTRLARVLADQKRALEEVDAMAEMMSRSVYKQYN